MKKALLALVILGLVWPFAVLRAQRCWGQGSGPVGPMVSAPIAHQQVTQWHWKESGTSPGEWGLYRNGSQVGAYSQDSGEYWPISNGQWGQACAPPISPPTGSRKQAGVMQDFGMDWSKIGKGGYAINGQNCSKEKAYQAVQQGLPDDANKLRFTVIGQQTERGPVIKDLASFPDVAQRVLPWSVDKNHWSLKDNVTGEPLFETSGKPTIYLQAPDGEVLYRENDYRGFQDFEAIRKAIKDYDARKDPGRGGASKPFAWDEIPAPVWVGGAVLGLILFRRLKA